MIVSMSVCVCVVLVLVMARYVRACYCAKMAHKFRARFRLQFFVGICSVPLCRFHKISVFLYFSYIAQLFCIFFFLWYSSKLNDFASALGLVNQIVAEYCLLFFRKPFRLSFYLIVCWQTDALNASRKWFCSLRFDDFKGQKEISLSALIFMSAN